MLINSHNTVIYTGVTANLVKRVYQHKMKRGSVFTAKYKVNKLVYYEVFEDIEEAIKREKQIKSGSRQKKISFITTRNPEFKDLYSEIASA